ncbi:MAG: transposase [Planctomycetales bacterium]|nr:transposase [Planctomycetales bacterium]
MPRPLRASAANTCYHVLNRGNAQGEVFHKPEDYAAFLEVLDEASRRTPMRLLAYCLMPNHFHLVVWTRRAGDLSQWMQWLTTAHVRRYHRHYQSSGHVWQGRFKSFPIQSDEHLLTVMRYVERNPVRARGVPVRKAQNWPWSSIGTPPPEAETIPTLHPGPVPRRRDWLDWVNTPLTAAEQEAVKLCLDRGQPYGETGWRQRAAKRLGLESTLRPRGRPRKTSGPAK